MTKAGRPHDEPTTQMPGQRLLDGLGWRLPSGIALTQFAWRGGFLSSRLWDETTAWGRRSAQGSPRELASVPTQKEPRQ
jgi:hypothetical protein